MSALMDGAGSIAALPAHQKDKKTS